MSCIENIRKQRIERVDSEVAPLCFEDWRWWEWSYSNGFQVI